MKRKMKHSHLLKKIGYIRSFGFSDVLISMLQEKRIHL